MDNKKTFRSYETLRSKCKKQLKTTKKNLKKSKKVKNEKNEKKKIEFKIEDSEIKIQELHSHNLKSLVIQKVWDDECSEVSLANFIIRWFAKTIS